MADKERIREVNGFRLAEIGDDCLLQKYEGTDERVVIPEGVTIIAPLCFYGCVSLKAVEFPDSLRVIESYAFYNCPNYMPRSLSAIRMAENCFYNCGPEQLYTVTWADIRKEEMAFYVRNYQRGYRWTRPQLLSFIKDLGESKKDNTRCFMQPIVVKKVPLGKYNAVLKKDGSCDYAVKTKSDTEEEQKDIPDYVYEIVDGQQRLTTLWILLTLLKENLFLGAREPRDPGFSIYYENRREIDQQFHQNARKVIAGILGGNDKKTSTYIDRYGAKLLKALYDDDRLTFVWYQFENENAEAKFRTLNDGQIALTSSELTKAALMNALKDSSEQIGIASEWNRIEQRMQEDEFWYFLSRCDYPDKNRMDLLLELYVRRHDERVDLNQDNFPFYALMNDEKGLFTDAEKAKEFWNEFRSLFDHLQSWYEDDELYSHIGYLIACSGKREGFALASEELVKIVQAFYWSKTKTKADFLESLKYMVEEQIKPAKENMDDPDFYENVKTKHIRDFLLCFNVRESQKGGVRFPFAKFNHTIRGDKVTNWDVEHISAVTMKSKLSDSDKEKLHGWALKEWESMGADPSEFDWDAFTKMVNNNPDHSIANLVLLDSNTNRGYKNDLFLEKRNTIIALDKEGHFIPLGTKNVFLKYYTKNPETQAAWTEDDRRDYREAIKNCME